MQTKDLIFNNSRHRYVVKEGGKHDPYVFIAKLFLAFVVKAVNLCDSPRLMVSSGQMYPFRVSDLEGNKERDGLYRIVTSIYKISHEEIVGEGYVSTDGEQLNQVMQLTMDVPAYSYRRSHRSCIGLLGEDGDSFICY